jgi:hypothetical protein
MLVHAATLIHFTFLIRIIIKQTSVKISIIVVHNNVLAIFES